MRAEIKIVKYLKKMCNNFEKVVAIFLMCNYYRDTPQANSIFKIELFSLGMNAYVKEWHLNESRSGDIKMSRNLMTQIYVKYIIR